MVSLNRFLYFIFFSALLLSCAQQYPLTGGEKDVDGPQIERFSPKNFSVNFNATGFEIKFDEYIQLKNIQENTIISPAMVNAPDFRLKGKKLEVKFNEPLKDSVTYTFNFGNSVVDFHEGNAAEELKYVFSTGTRLDSGAVRGFVKNAEILTPEEGVWVMLYDKYYDSIPKVEQPLYLSKTDESGSFHIKNIRPGKYKMFALKDVNYNYLYDLDNEAVAYLDTLIEIGDSLSETVFNLYMFQKEIDKQYIKETKNDEVGNTVFILNKKISDININGESLRSNKDFIYNSFVETDTISIWNTTLPKDSLMFYTLNNENLSDTIELSPLRFTDSLNKVNDHPKTLKLHAETISKINPEYPLSILFERPVKLIDTSKIILFNSKDSSKLLVNSFEVNPNDILSLKINTEDIDYGSSYELILDSNAITDIYGVCNDSVSVKLSTIKAEYYGFFFFTINVDSIPESQKVDQYILELYTDKDDLIRRDTITETKELQYLYLEPINYKAKIIYDRNKNGKWDTGDYDQGTQPERTFYYSSNIGIKEDWDIEIEWIIEF